MLENRVAMTRLLPGLFAHYRVRPVDHYPALLRTALAQVAPTGGEEEATVVVWTPGPFNSAYFEHAFLARQMGVELVEASDLVVRDAVCHMRTTHGLQRVHAIYRRIDDDFMDPLEFRPDSMLGVPGLDARLPGGQRGDRQRGRHRRRRRQGDLPLRAGDDPLLPRRGADPRQRADLPDDRRRPARVGARAARRDGGQADQRVGRQGRLHRADGDRARRSSARPRRSLRSPERWIAQELVRLSTVPTAGADGALAPRHVDLRPFAVFGEDIRIVPGGLTRVALREGSMIVNSSQGGGSKDTWVLDEGVDTDRAESPRRALVAAADARPQPAASGRPAAAATAAAVVLARIAHELYWIGRQLARAEHTARMLDGVFHADVQAQPDDPAGVLLSWDHLLTIVSGEPPEQPGLARRGAARAHARSRVPDLGAQLRHARARGRAHGARRLLGRDVGGDQHVPPRAAAARHVGRAAQRARTRSTRTCASAAGCSGA